MPFSEPLPWVFRTPETAKPLPDQGFTRLRSVTDQEMRSNRNDAGRMVGRWGERNRSGNAL